MTLPNVRIGDTPHGGKSLIATTAIAAGSLIFNEAKPLVRLPHELLVLPGSSTQTPLQRATAAEMLKLSLAGASTEQKRAFAGLSNAWKGVDAGGGLNVLLLVFLTNAVKTEDSDAVFELVSRMNHSCTPKACYYVHRDHEPFQGISVYAATDIAAGEEVTISYLDPLLPSTQRQALLKAAYNFDCVCPTCSLSESLKASDERRAKVIEYKEHLRDWQAGTRSAKEVIKEARGILGDGGIIEIEGLNSERGALWMDLTTVTASHSSTKATIQAATAASVYFGMLTGPQSIPSLLMFRHAKDPKSHPSWGKKNVEEVQIW